MRLAVVVPAVLVALTLAACGTSESSLTKADVEKKLTVNPPPKGTKRLLTADCTEKKKNRYTCQVVTQDHDKAKLDVKAEGTDILVIAAQVEN